MDSGYIHSDREIHGDLEKKVGQSQMSDDEARGYLSEFPNCEYAGCGQNPKRACYQHGEGCATAKGYKLSEQNEIVEAVAGAEVSDNVLSRKKLLQKSSDRQNKYCDKYPCKLFNHERVSETYCFGKYDSCPIYETAHLLNDLKLNDNEIPSVGKRGN